MKAWKILKSRHVFQHFWYTLRQDTVQLPDGRVIDDYFVSVRRDVAIILALTSDRQVPLVRQYKHGVGKILLELPGGFVDDGEESYEAAQRELLEETGYVSDEFQLLARIHDNPTKDTNTLNLYLATDAVKTHAQTLDQTEAIAIELVPLHQLRAYVIDGKIAVAGSISAIYLALERLRQLS